MKNNHLEHNNLEHNNLEHNNKKILYFSDFICTYNLINEYQESLILYQIQFLQAFNINNFDDNKINSITEELFEKFKSNKYIIKLIDSNNFNDNDIFINDDLSKFRSYFGYDAFYAFHKLLNELLNAKDNFNLLLIKK